MRGKVERVFWGVSFTNAKGERIEPLFGSWHDSMLTPRYDGEPSRAVLFRTRAQAREWCRAERARYEGRQDCCVKWRFTPVRVTETQQVA